MAGWLTRSLTDVPAGQAWLGPSERAVLAGLRIDKRRDDWRLGRYAAKHAAGLFLGIEPERIEVIAGPGGAPAAWCEGAPAALELSLSHRAGRALAVAAPSGAPSGCDLELVEPRSKAFIEQWLAPAESALVRAAAESDRAWLANLIWSAKEASTKARGEGLRLDLGRAVVKLGGVDGADGDWLPFHVDWDFVPAERDHGWYRREPEWVMTVVGGEAGTRPRELG